MYHIHIEYFSLAIAYIELEREVGENMQRIIFKRRKVEFVLMFAFVTAVIFFISFLDRYLLAENKMILNMDALYLGTFVGLLGEVFYGMLCMPNEFRLAITMGKTRKEFLRCEILVTMTWLLLLYLTIGVIFGVGILIGSIVQKENNIMALLESVEIGKYILYVVLTIVVITILQLTLFLATESNGNLVKIGYIILWSGSVLLEKFRKYYEYIVDSLSGVFVGNYLPLIILISIFVILYFWGRFVIKKLLRLQVKMP